jgi:hypothetical protein
MTEKYHEMFNNVVKGSDTPANPIIIKNGEIDV